MKAKTKKIVVWVSAVLCALILGVVIWFYIGIHSIFEVETTELVTMEVPSRDYGLRVSHRSGFSFDWGTVSVERTGSGAPVILAVFEAYDEVKGLELLDDSLFRLILEDHWSEGEVRARDTFLINLEQDSVSVVRFKDSH